MPDETLSAILDFHVVPPAIDDEVKRLFNERDLGEDDDPLVCSNSKKKIISDPNIVKS